MIQPGLSNPPVCWNSMTFDILRFQFLKVGISCVLCLGVVVVMA